jgi:hypothetical protein
VIEFRGEDFVAETDDGARLTVKAHNRSGKGSRSRIAIGAKVKLYRRETEDFWRYRFVGG